MQVRHSASINGLLKGSPLEARAATRRGSAARTAAEEAGSGEAAWAVGRPGEAELVAAGEEAGRARQRGLKARVRLLRAP